MSDAKELLEEIYRELSPAFFPKELHLKLSRFLGRDMKTGQKRLTPFPWVLVKFIDLGGGSEKVIIEGEFESEKEAESAYKLLKYKDGENFYVDVRRRPCVCIGASHQANCIDWVMPL